MILRKLALKHGTDKAGHHEYCEAYEFFLSSYRERRFTLLELGVGGEEYPDRGGESLRMWREYFRNARIYGVDLYPKTFTVPNVKIFQGSQDDRTFLADLLSEIGDPEVIIDDASHINELSLVTFETLFPALKPGGLYVIEDVQTSYWARLYGGGRHPRTVIEYFKNQIEGLHKTHLRDTGDVDALPAIESIHFFKEIVFIRKHA